MNDPETRANFILGLILRATEPYRDSRFIDRVIDVGYTGAHCDNLQYIRYLCLELQSLQLNRLS